MVCCVPNRRFSPIQIQLSHLSGGNLVAGWTATATPSPRPGSKPSCYASSGMTSVCAGTPVTSMPPGSSSTSTSLRKPRPCSGR